MDVSRAVLDNLMGRDRNKPNDLITERDHYSNPDVCKPFLVCLCFNTLFPNTTYDQGPCEKRHDTYLKTMFDNDPARGTFEREYIKEYWIQRRLQDVEKKTKQNQGVIDNKSNFPADRPKQILDRVLAIQQDISHLIIQSQKFGQLGKIDDSVRCLEQVEKLRQRRRQIQSMGSDMQNAQKQQKICHTCGAIQTINDTQKRIQTHLQGKIHQGFLKLRHEVQTLRIKLQILNKLNPPQVKQQKQIQMKSEKKQPKQVSVQTKDVKLVRQQKQKQRSPSESKKRKQKKQRSRSKQRKEKPVQRQRERQRDHRHKDSERRDDNHRDRSRDKKQAKQRKHYRDSRQRQHKQKHKQNKDRQRQRDHKDKQRSKERDQKDKQRQKDRDHKKKHKRNKSKSRSRQRQQKRAY